MLLGSPINTRPAICWLVIILTGLAAGCDPKKEIVYTGPTMGTTYQVKVVVNRFSPPRGLQENIDRRLDQINRSMSTYLKDSEISRFNAWNRAGVPFAVSKDFLAVMTAAARLHDLSRGAWDPTVDPLSPENLTCDGELPQYQVQDRSAHHS